MMSADKLVTGTYDTGISGCLKEVRVLEGLLQRKMPAVSKHLRKRDVDLIAVVPQWFLSLFSQDFPFEVCAALLRVLGWWPYRLQHSGEGSQHAEGLAQKHALHRMCQLQPTHAETKHPRSCCLSCLHIISPYSRV